MWLEGRLSTIVYPIYRFLKRVKPVKKSLCVTSEKPEKYLDKYKFLIETGGF